MTTAAALLAELRRRGVELRPAGDRIRYRPAAAVPPELVAELRQHKAAVLALLTQPEKVSPRARSVRSYRYPWPDALPGLGPHAVIPFELCRARPGCSTWTWAAYGATPTCYRCARALADAS